MTGNKRVLSRYLLIAAGARMRWSGSVSFAQANKIAPHPIGWSQVGQ
jgi:hypothetical protein